MLCIDIGNTSIKLAGAVSGRVGRVQIIASTATATEIARALSRAAPHGSDRAAIASVHPQATERMRKALRRERFQEALVIDYRLKLPIVIATRHPGRVGADRISAACGAVAGRGRHAIVVDAGSAITVDLVLDRRFVGGVIMPGPQMMLSALHYFTAQLPDLRIGEGEDRGINDTAPAMRTGAVVGAAGAIEAAVLSLRRQAGRPVPVWVTGGHARRLRSRLPSGWKFKADLTLVGIEAIARLNPAE
jgi:type III pantothenate kinase